MLTLIMHIKIRTVSINDNQFLAQMIRQVFLEYDAPQQGTVYSDASTDHLFELFQKPLSHLWVAENNSQIVGCCGIYPTSGLPAGCVELVKFYITKEARGKGLGRQLMQKSIDMALSFGYTQMYIESLPEFSTAVSIYEKQGFIKLEYPLGNSGHNGCNIWMIKDLINN